MFYGQTSEYYWTDEDSEVWPIEQGDGGEQGDPLMPALFALGLHSALVSSDDKLQELMFESGPIPEDGEGYFTPLLFAFLDDLYFFFSLPFFFRIHSALCLDPQAGGKVAKRRVLCFLAALWAFAFRPLLGVR